MVNTELVLPHSVLKKDYNILNIVVNTEPLVNLPRDLFNYNILNIVVNTELFVPYRLIYKDYNILNIVVNTEPWQSFS